MREYFIKRIILVVIVLFTIVTVNFVIFQVLSPIDPVDLIIDPNFDPSQRALLRQQFGLDESLAVRYSKYIVNMITWQFGRSFRSRMLVVEEMTPLLANTVLLLGTALVATIMVGIPVGILAASRRGTKLDVLAMGSGLFTWGVPVFFVELLSMFFLSYYLSINYGVQVFPVAGMAEPGSMNDPLTYMADVAWHLAQPVMTLTLAGFGSWALYTRNMLIEALTEDYIVTARAKGISERNVLFRHAFRSTLPPMVTLVALSIPSIVMGAMITEYVFSWPGIGRWYLESMENGDYPVVQAILYIYAILTILANFISDFLYGILDPRIRVGVRR